MTTVKEYISGILLPEKNCCFKFDYWEETSIRIYNSGFFHLDFDD